MFWMNEYLDRAQQYANMPTGPEASAIWSALADDIRGKLSLDQAVELYDFVLDCYASDIQPEGAMAILYILPDDL